MITFAIVFLISSPSFSYRFACLYFFTGPHEIEQVITPKSKKSKKKRAASELDSLTAGDVSDVGKNCL